MSNNMIQKDEDSSIRSKTYLIIRLLKYLKPYKQKTFVATITMVIAMLFGLINPYLLKVAIDTYISQKNVKGLLSIGIVLVILNFASWILSKIRFQLIAEITNSILVTIRQ